MAKHVKVYGWDGTGNTVKEARQDAVSQIEKAAEGYWSPTVVSYKGMVGLVWREPAAYYYTIVRYGEARTETVGKDYFTAGGYGEEEVVRSLCSHLAQNGFSPETDDWKVRPEILKDANVGGCPPATIPGSFRSYWWGRCGPTVTRPGSTLPPLPRNTVREGLS